VNFYVDIAHYEEEDIMTGTLSREKSNL